MLLILFVACCSEELPKVYLVIDFFIEKENLCFTLRRISIKPSVSDRIFLDEKFSVPAQDLSPLDHKRDFLGIEREELLLVQVRFFFFEQNLSFCSDFF